MMTPRDELIDRIGMAIQDQLYDGPATSGPAQIMLTSGLCMSAADRVLAAIEAAGCTIVPNEATEERRMDAYYYGFTPTGVDAIDKILSAVACAGKSVHHTGEWTLDLGAEYGDHTGATPVDWIQNAANEAASPYRIVK